jgi:hypothetical protein
LSGAVGELGPALTRLTNLDDPGEGLARLRGAEDDPDYPAARKLARALARAKVYVLSGLAEDQAEELGMIALGDASESRRLAESARSCLFLSRAESTRAVVAGPEE